MSIFMHELKAYGKFTLIWTASFIAVLFLFFSLFPSISKEAEEFEKVLEGFPEAVRQALGLSVENIGSILGYYSYGFIYISLMGAIEAMNLGVSIISKEIRGKTADFILTKPIARIQVLNGKICAAFISLVITNVVYLPIAITMASLVELQKYNIKIFIMITSTLFFTQVLFLSLGIIIAVLIPKIRSALPISLGTVFIFFIIGALVSASGDSSLRYITPFQYYDFNYIIENAKYEYSFILISMLFIALFIAVSYFIYRKRDVHAV